MYIECDEKVWKSIGNMQKIPFFVMISLFQLHLEEKTTHKHTHTYKCIFLSE